jgi:hypothetical protein
MVQSLHLAWPNSAFVIEFLLLCVRFALGISQFTQDLFSVLEYDRFMKFCLLFVNLQRIKLCRDHGFLVIKQTLAFVYLDELSYQSRSKHFVLVTMSIQIPVSSVTISNDPGCFFLFFFS